jgi:hypothetical protein
MFKLRLLDRKLSNVGNLPPSGMHITRLVLETRDAHNGRPTRGAVNGPAQRIAHLSLQALGDKTKMHALVKMLRELVYEELEA